MPGLTHWQHPSFFAYYPTASTFEGIIGDLYSTTALNPGFNVCVLWSSVVPPEANTFGTQWICSPACTELEAVVMDWAARLFGLSEDFYNTSQVGGGVIQASRTTWSSQVLED